MEATGLSLPLSEGFLGCQETFSTKTNQTEIVDQTSKFLYSFLPPS